MRVKVSNYFGAVELQISADQARRLNNDNEPEKVLTEEQKAAVKTKFRNQKWEDLIIFSAEGKEVFPSILWIYKEPAHFRYHMS